NDTILKVVKGKLRKPYRGGRIKVSTPSSSSDGAGHMLTRLRSAKISGKARVRVDSSPLDNRGGRRVVSSPENDVIKKVLSDVRSGAIDNLKFSIGSSIDNIDSKCSMNCNSNVNEVNIGLNFINDGSFIKEPLCPSNDSVIDIDSESPVAFSSVVKDSVEPARTSDVGMLVMLTLSLWFPLLMLRHEWILRLGRWIALKNLYGFGSRMMYNQYSTAADSFAEKLKQGVEELVLKIKYMPNSISKLDNVIWVFCGYVNGLQLWMIFARVLVEVSAVDDLPNMLEIAYPPIRNSPAKVGRLDVKYQWKHPLCTHCKTFGHSTMSCKVRPMTEEENAAAILNEALKVGSCHKDVVGSSLNDDVFVTVGKKNKPVDKKAVPPLVNSNVKQDFKFLNKGGCNYGRQHGIGNQYNGKQGNQFWQAGKGFKKQGSFVGNEKSKQQGGSFKKNVNVTSNSENNNSNDVGIQKKSLRQLSQDPNFKPKVLVRGFGSGGNVTKTQEESVPVSNSFDLLFEEAMNKEYDSSIFLWYDGKQGNQFWQAGKGFKKQGSFVGNEKSKQQGGSFKKNVNVTSNSENNNSNDVGIQKKSLRQLSQDPNFKPKVLVRGFGSGGNVTKTQEESVPVSNSFDLLFEEAMNKEYDSSIFLWVKGIDPGKIDYTKKTVKYYEMWLKYHINLKLNSLNNHQ
nr:hypothetical protein [Tanacetum cinerariifolium]